MGWLGVRLCVRLSLGDGEAEFGRVWLGLLIVCVEGRVVHKPLQAAGRLVGLVEMELDMEINRKDVCVIDSREWEQWHGHGKIILEDYLSVSFALREIPPSSDLHYGSQYRHNTCRLISVAWSGLLFRSRLRQELGSGSKSGCH